MAYYYIEEDGRVFLVEREGKFTFPKSEGEIDFKIKTKREMPVEDEEIYYCEPELDRFPKNWPLKDKLVLRDDVDRVVKKAVNLSYLRHSSQGLIPKEGKPRKILMILASRGLTKGFWNLPGGFITYGERPEESLKREVEEEVGLKIETKKLTGVYTEVFKKSGYYMIVFTYLCTAAGGGIRTGEEIGKVKYLTVEEGIEKTKNPFVKRALEDYKELKKI